MVSVARIIASHTGKKLGMKFIIDKFNVKFDYYYQRFTLQIDSLILPNHWMKDFFLGHLLIDLQLNKEAEEAYKIILKNGFQNSQYILGQIAICQHNCKGN